METNNIYQNKNVLACIRTLNSHFPGEFILVGGGSMVTRRCDRTTNDVDVLIPASTNMGQLHEKLIESTWFFQDGGRIFVKPAIPVDNPFPEPLKIDILKDIVSGVGYDDVIHHTDKVAGTLIPSLSMSIGVKLRCWYLRAEDQNGTLKKRSDLEDVVFLARLIQDQGARVDSSVAIKVKISHYNLLLVRLVLEDKNVELLQAVGCDKFLRNYDDDNPDQREYYEAMGAQPYTNPLVVELEEEEEEETEGKEEEEGEKAKEEKEEKVEEELAAQLANKLW